MGQILPLLFLKLFDPISFSFPSVKYVTIFIYHWKGSCLEKSSHLVFASSFAMKELFDSGKCKVPPWASVSCAVRTETKQDCVPVWHTVAASTVPEVWLSSDAQSSLLCICHICVWCSRETPTLRTLSSSQIPRRGFSQMWTKLYLESEQSLPPTCHVCYWFPQT